MRGEWYRTDTLWFDLEQINYVRNDLADVNYPRVVIGLGDRVVDLKEIEGREFLRFWAQRVNDITIQERVRALGKEKEKPCHK